MEDSEEEKNFSFLKWDEKKNTFLELQNHK